MKSQLNAPILPSKLSRLPLAILASLTVLATASAHAQAPAGAPPAAGASVSAAAPAGSPPAAAPKAFKDVIKDAKEIGGAIYDVSERRKGVAGY